MDTILEYLVKSSISLLVFYLFFWILNRKSTHFMLNRLVLLFGLVSSLILPCIHINVDPEVIPAAIPVTSIDFSKLVNQAETSQPGWGMHEIILLIYTTGIAFTLARLVYQAIRIRQLYKKSAKETLQELTLVCTDHPITPFAYFKKIFIHKTGDDQYAVEQILAHEKSHIMQLHYVDLLLVELIAVVQWFNPVVWLYEAALKEVHEYLADETVLKQGYKKGEYQVLLINQAVGGPIFTISHHFNKSLIKKRILMMTKIKTPRLAQLKVLFLLPLTACLLMAFSNPENIVKPVFQSAKQLAAGLNAATQQQQAANPDTITVTVKTSGNTKQAGSKNDTIIEKTEKIKAIVIVDGVEKPDFNDKDINPETIETINVYKGDKATELYGEKGKNGVVVVSTKKIVKQSGSDKTEITVNTTESNFDKAYVVVDGVHDPDFIKNNKNPENIESIDILKGESATALYGEKGKNGVIIITLKKKK